MAATIKPRTRMFKLLTMIALPTRSRPAAQNVYNTYAVAMPADLLPALQKRLTCLIMYRLYGCACEHYMATTDLIRVDRLLTRYYTDEAHNLILDGRELSLLKGFLTIERIIVGRARPQVHIGVSNHDVWCLVGEALASAIRPTQVVDLSFYP